MAMAQRSHYDVLEVSRQASETTISAAYQALVARAQATTDAAERESRLRSLQIAFVVLTDEQLRKRYDDELEGKGVEATLERPVANPAAIEVQDSTRAAPVTRTMSRQERAKVAFESGSAAGLLQRTAAYMLDSIALGIPAYVVTVPVAIGLDISNPGALLGMALGVWILVNALFLNVNMATPGKMATGVAIVDHQAGTALPFGRALVRSAVTFFCTLFIVPQLLLAFDKKKRSFADLAAGSVAVNYSNGRHGSQLVWVVVGLFVALGVVGNLAAIALPQYEDYVTRQRIAEARAHLNDYAHALEQYFQRHQRLPAALTDLGYQAPAKVATFSIDKDSNIYAVLSASSAKTRYIAISPQREQDGRVWWKCYSSGFSETTRPKDCESLD